MWVLFAFLTIAARGFAADGDVAAIGRARAAMNTAFNAHDMSALSAFMTDTLTISGPVWRLVGRQQVANAHQALQADGTSLLMRNSSHGGGFTFRFSAIVAPTSCPTHQ
jgi:hypothetical protein